MAEFPLLIQAFPHQHSRRRHGRTPRSSSTKQQSRPPTITTGARIRRRRIGSTSFARAANFPVLSFPLSLLKSFLFCPGERGLGEADLDREIERDLLRLALCTSTSEPIGDMSSRFDPDNFRLEEPLLPFLRELELEAERETDLLGCFLDVDFLSFEGDRDRDLDLDILLRL